MASDRLVRLRTCSRGSGTDLGGGTIVALTGGEILEETKRLEAMYEDSWRCGVLVLDKRLA